MVRSLRIMVDARMLIGRFSGVARVVTRLVEELTRDGGIKVAALCGDVGYERWSKRSDIEVIRSSFTRRDRAFPRRLRWEATNLRKLIASADVDLYHATWNFGIPRRCPVPSVLTIHDLIPWSFDKNQGRPLLPTFCFRHAVRSSARRSDRIVTVSDTVRQQVVAKLGMQAASVVTVPNGVDLPDGEVESKRESSVNFALYVGGHEPRKNVAGVLRAMRSYWRRFDPALELRLTGHARSLAPDAAAVLSDMPADAPIRFLGDVSDAELAYQYSTARLLLLLSHEEGFGLPVLEAMAHGCPVVAANRTSLPEVVGDAGFLVDAADADGVAATMRRLVSEEVRFAEFASRGRARAKEFGWNLVADRMRAVYESALATAGRASGSVAVPARAPVVERGLGRVSMP